MAETRIYVDLTTAFEERHRIPHGTTRVERKLVEAFAGLGRTDVSFCRFDRGTLRFIAMSQLEALAAVTAQPVADAKRQARVSSRNNPAVAQLHKLEVWVRRNIRDRFRLARRETARVITQSADIFETGSILLLPGELQRHDFATLMRLRQRLNVRLAFVFHDLLDTLTNDDSRAHDPKAVNIPGSEFILREASLVLPNSFYSEGELRKHAAKRGLTLPPIQTIRLGHEIAKVSAAKPVAGLTSGHFVLTVGDVTARKNHRLLTEIWDALTRQRETNPPVLVIAGRIGTDGQRLVAACNADPHTASTVRFLSDVDDAQLIWLYRNCRFTLFPSLSEGFGLPVVESLAFGKPCIASNVTSIPEASQGVAIHIDPHDAVAWQRAIERMLDDDQALARAKQDIANRFRMTGWAETASDVLGAIRRELLQVEPRVPVVASIDKRP